MSSKKIKMPSTCQRCINNPYKTIEQVTAEKISCWVNQFKPLIKRWEIRKQITKEEHL